MGSSRGTHTFHNIFRSHHISRNGRHTQQESRSQSKSSIYSDSVSLGRWHIDDQSVVYLMWSMRRQPHKFIRPHSLHEIDRINVIVRCAQTDKFQTNALPRSFSASIDFFHRFYFVSDIIYIITSECIRCTSARAPPWDNLVCAPATRGLLAKTCSSSLAQTISNLQKIHSK